jgi:UDP-N-acetylglucosamine 4,6-dehydratase
MKYLIIGGTGTLGTELTAQLLRRKDTEAIVCFSRDEHKQVMQAKRFNHPKLSFVLGDIRDPASIRSALRLHAFDTVFHVAALKHVPVGQTEVREFTLTNLIGTFNVSDAAIDFGVKHVVFSSTDKAVDPINAYGALKLASEVFLYSQNRYQKTRFSVFRWGNVLGSNGSVIQDFVRQILTSKTFTLTHPEMSRFWIRIEDAVAFMIANYQDAPPDRALIPPIRAAKVERVAQMIATILRRNATAKTTEIRPGEKLHEVLSSLHTMLPTIRSNDPDRQLTDSELRMLLGPLVEEMGRQVSEGQRKDKGVGRWKDAVMK